MSQPDPGNRPEESLGRELRALLTVYAALGLLALLYGAAFGPSS